MHKQGITKYIYEDIDCNYQRHTGIYQSKIISKPNKDNNVKFSEEECIG